MPENVFKTWQMITKIGGEETSFGTLELRGRQVLMMTNEVGAANPEIKQIVERVRGVVQTIAAKRQAPPDNQVINYIPDVFAREGYEVTLELDPGETELPFNSPV